MKRAAFLILSLVLAVVTGGCQTGKYTDNKYTFDAIVISAAKDSLMAAVSGKGEVLSPFEPASVSYGNIKADEFKRGTVIRITYDGSVRESYPVQLTAKKIKVIEAVKDNWPPTLKLDKNYSIKDAKDNGCYVEGLLEKENTDIAIRFTEMSSQGICAYLRKVSYTEEGDPVITDFIYDGTKYYVMIDATRDKFAGSGSKITSREYSYINTYTKDGKKVIYLADMKDISTEDYEKAALDTFTVCSD